MSENIGADRFDWERQIRASRLPPMTKLVALTAATYADPDGTRVFPGTAQLAVVCGISYDTVRKALRKLRKAGLVEQVSKGCRGQATVYRLIFAEDLVERLEWLTPAQIKLEAERLNQLNAQGARLRYQRDPGTAEGGAGNAPPQDLHPAGSAPLPEHLRYPRPAETAICGTGEPLSAVPPSHPPNQVPDHTSTNPNNGDLRTDLTLVGEQAHQREIPKFCIEEEDQNPAETALTPRRLPSRAQLTIAAAQQRMAALRAAHATESAAS